MANAFDQFDEKGGANVFDQFEEQERPAIAAGPDTIQEGIGERIGREVKEIPRQAGLALRSGLQGAGGVVDFLGTPLHVPIQAATRFGLRVSGADPEATGLDLTGGGRNLANLLNLPTPETPLERVIGKTEEIITAGGGMMGLAGKMSQLSKAGGVSKSALKALTARPELQLSSAIGSGVAGGYAKESGANPLQQTIAAVLGGVALPLGVASTQRTVAATKSLIDRLMKDPQLTGKIDMVIDSAIRDQGIRLSDLPKSVHSQLTKDIRKALENGEMTPDVVRRLVDYRMTGLTPTAGPLSLDPGTITKQKNLAALGASSADPKLQQLSQIENQNAKKLIENINQLGANKPGDNFAAGQKIIDAISAKNTAKTAKINELYKKARGTAGRSAELDPSVFAQKANDLLDEAMLGGKLPADVRNNLNAIATGKMPLTVDVAEQLKTSMATLQRSTIDKAEKLALGYVRSALDDTPLLQGQGAPAIKAFNAARTANREWMKTVDATPALKAVRDGVEPDKFVQTFIIGTGKAASLNPVMQLKKTIKDNPEALTAVKDNMAQYMKTKALSGAADEVGRFSQSAYNKALSSIGDAKLKMFFSADEVQALKAIGRVASYEQAQPTGSAVNNSRTAAAALATVLDKIGGSSILRKVPMGAEIVANPLRSVSGSLQAGGLTKIPIAAKPSKEGMMLVAPALAPYLMAGSE